MRFWCDGLGFTVAEHYDLTDAMIPGLAEALEVPSPVTVRSQMIRLDDLKIEVLSYENPAVQGIPSTSRGSRGYTHLSFLTADIDAFAQRLVEHGGTILTDTRRNVGIEVVFLADPDGTRIELMQG
jgi:catechol 2,3-dioxygenase-like lactoylglutathione lyase family enzyme